MEALLWDDSEQAVRDPDISTVERDWFESNAWRDQLRDILSPSDDSIGGNPASQTGLNTSIEPMLWHDSKSIYHLDAITTGLPIWCSKLRETQQRRQREDADVQPWLDVAKTFEMNADFDLGGREMPQNFDFRGMMKIMKEESASKLTIQILSDKLLLHRIVDNLGIAQMPLLLVVEGPVSVADVEALVDNHLTGSSHEPTVILKPTHLSSCTGFKSLTPSKAHERAATVDFLVNHVEKYMAQQAPEYESEALQMLRPGFIAQPNYKSVVSFKVPMELRVIVLWGHARLAFWWWGREVEESNRNSWFARRHAGKLNLEQNTWQIIHDHARGTNRGFDNALKLFQRHIHEIVRAAEALATAVGAPWLRADFFVGSREWGVRLNEVAYGCALDYRNILVDEYGNSQVVDDAPAIARILQDGMRVCRFRLPMERFLSRLGVQGTRYQEISVTKLQVALLPVQADSSVQDCVSESEAFGVPESQCCTPEPPDRIFERPARLPAIYLELIEQMLVPRCRLIQSRLAQRCDVERAHPTQYDALIKKYPSDEEARVALNLGSGYFSSSEADLTLSEIGRVANSAYSALMSAGTVVDLCIRVAQGELANGLALVRPPGHHCGRNEAPWEQSPSKGHGLLNNIAIAVNTIRQQLGVQRVLIVDWDIHHGDGTQSIFESDPNVLFVSLHRFDEAFSSNTGSPVSVGSGAGTGKSVNIGWSYGTLNHWSGPQHAGDAECMAAFHHIIMPIARSFDPHFVIVSAGFGGAVGEPEGGMRISPNGFACMTKMLKTLAHGKLCIVLEGGYNLRSTAVCVAAVLRVLLGEALEEAALEDVDKTALEDLRRTARAQAPYWPIIGSVAAELTSQLNGFSSTWSLAVRTSADLDVRVRKAPQGVLYLDKIKSDNDKPVESQLAACNKVEPVDSPYYAAVLAGWEEHIKLSLQHHEGYHECDDDCVHITRSVRDWVMIVVDRLRNDIMDFQKGEGVDKSVAFLEKCLCPGALGWRPFRLRMTDRTGKSCFL